MTFGSTLLVGGLATILLIVCTAYVSLVREHRLLRMIDDALHRKLSELEENNHIFGIHASGYDEQVANGRWQVEHLAQSNPNIQSFMTWVYEHVTVV